MAIDAFLYFKDKKSVKGESLDSDMSLKEAFEIKDFSFSVKQALSIGSFSGGGGAGKADFEEFEFTKRTDTASCPMFLSLCAGTHFAEAFLEIRRAGASNNKSGGTFMMIQFKMVMIAQMGWTAGEDSLDEKVNFQFGAIKIEYKKQNMDGTLTSAGNAEWSRTKNSQVYMI